MVADTEHFTQTASSLKTRRHVQQDVAQQHTNGMAGDFHLSHVTHSSVLNSGAMQWRDLFYNLKQSMKQMLQLFLACS